MIFTALMEMVFAQIQVPYMTFYNAETEDTFVITMLRWFFYMNPAFPLSILFGLITRIGANHMLFASFSWEEGSKYYYSDFMKEESGVDATGIAYKVPSPFTILCVQFLTICIYLLLTWYLDHVITTNRGVSE